MYFAFFVVLVGTLLALAGILWRSPAVAVMSRPGVPGCCGIGRVWFPSPSGDRWHIDSAHTHVGEAVRPVPPTLDGDQEGGPRKAADS